MAHHKDLTGRDAYVIVEALTFTIDALSGLPIDTGRTITSLT
jgi:hypothetical protein